MAFCPFILVVTGTLCSVDGGVVAGLCPSSPSGAVPSACVRSVSRATPHSGASAMYPRVVALRTDVTGGIGIRVQHNPVPAAKPAPMTMALQQVRPGGSCVVC